MKKVIIYTNANGAVSVCIPTGELPIEQVLAKDVPKGVTGHIVGFDSLPHQDSDFFNAWEQTDGVVTVSFSKAKEITKDRLRAERAPLLASQDVAFQRALEISADTTAIIAEKQRLRDITKLPDTCVTLDELRAIKCS